MASDNLCANGKTAAQSASAWGATMGFNISTPAQLSSAGMSFRLSSLPAQGLRVQVMAAADSTFYCALVTSTTQTIPWTAFNTACWNNIGTKLTGPPTVAQVGFVVTSAASPMTFDFCVQSLSFSAQVPYTGGDAPSSAKPDLGSDIQTSLPPGASCTSSSQCGSYPCTDG
jgi:hypothetical protein